MALQRKDQYKSPGMEDKPQLPTLRRCHAKLLECRQNPDLPYLNPFGSLRHFNSRNEVDLELARLEQLTREFETVNEDA